METVQTVAFRNVLFTALYYSDCKKSNDCLNSHILQLSVAFENRSLIMSTPALAPAFPVVELRSVANAQNEWVALLVTISADRRDASTSAFLQAVRHAGPAGRRRRSIASCCLDDPASSTPPVLNVLPANRILLAVCAARWRATAWRAAWPSCRCRLPRPARRPTGDGVAPPLALRTLWRATALDAAARLALPALFGSAPGLPVDSVAAYRECEQRRLRLVQRRLRAESALADDDDGTSRKRMLTMLGAAGARRRRRANWNSS
jgi:EAL and modified HD-GYP domain-containing signal transduction protein